MAKQHVTVHLSCGHATDVEVSNLGPSTQRWLQRVAGGKCDACQKADWRADKRARAAADIAACERMGLTLPALTGSDKQVRWAEEVRAALLVQAPYLAEVAASVTDARTWIDLSGIRLGEQVRRLTKKLPVAQRWAHGAVAHFAEIAIRRFQDDSVTSVFEQDARAIAAAMLENALAESKSWQPSESEKSGLVNVAESMLREAAMGWSASQGIEVAIAASAWTCN